MDNDEAQEINKCADCGEMTDNGWRNEHTEYRCAQCWAAIAD